jgi:hypothetical protein
MLTMQDLRDHYRFTDQDAELLQLLRPFAEENRERFFLEFYDYLYSLPHTPTKQTLCQHPINLKRR